MNISITITADSAEEVRAQMHRLLGHSALAQAGIEEIVVPFDDRPVDKPAEQPNDVSVRTTADEQPIPAPKKGRGRPKNPPKKASPDMIVDEPAQISTGEARTGPEDSPETQAQDAADEQAESEATRPATLTHDDVRNELSAYVKMYGMDAAQADGPQLFKLVFPDMGIEKISGIPDDQESLAKAIAGVKEMTAKNPYQRTAVL